MRMKAPCRCFNRTYRFLGTPLHAGDGVDLGDGHQTRLCSEAPGAHDLVAATGSAGVVRPSLGA